jgi:hypothetical protein
MTQFKTFAKIDLRWGFNNIQIREGDKYKAAFITNLGLYKPTVITFGLCNAPATMQTMMDDLMYKLAQTGKLVHVMGWNFSNFSLYYLDHKFLFSFLFLFLFFFSLCPLPLRA